MTRDFDQPGFKIQVVARPRSALPVLFFDDDLDARRYFSRQPARHKSFLGQHDDGGLVDFTEMPEIIMSPGEEHGRLQQSYGYQEVVAQIYSSHRFLL